jgi:hypothetical protein
LAPAGFVAESPREIVDDHRGDRAWHSAGVSCTSTYAFSLFDAAADQRHRGAREDFDDTFEGGPLHSSAVAVPAASASASGSAASAR